MPTSCRSSSLSSCTSSSNIFLGAGVEGNEIVEARARCVVVESLSCHVVDLSPRSRIPPIIIFIGQRDNYDGNMRFDRGQCSASSSMEEHDEEFLHVSGDTNAAKGPAGGSVRFESGRNLIRCRCESIAFAFATFAQHRLSATACGVARTRLSLKVCALPGDRSLLLPACSGSPSLHRVKLPGCIRMKFAHCTASFAWHRGLSGIDRVLIRAGGREEVGIKIERQQGSFIDASCPGRSCH